MKYYLALFLFLLFACNQEQKKTELEINPNQFVDQDIKLSDIADSVLYISFDTSVIFRGIRHCELIDDYILISTGEELLKFTDSGEYIQSIGSVVYWGDKEYLFQSCSAPDIKEKLSNTTNAKLAEWANSLEEDDNDILMLVQLK